MLAESVNVDSGLLWTVVAILVIICLIVWLFRNLR